MTLSTVSEVRYGPCRDRDGVAYMTDADVEAQCPRKTNDHVFIWMCVDYLIKIQQQCELPSLAKNISLHSDNPKQMMHIKSSPTQP